MSTVLAQHTPTATAPQPWRHDVAEYERLGAQGFLEGRRTELIDGEIFVRSPRGPRQSYQLMRVFETLRSSGWPQVWVRVQLPINLGQNSQPEPDICVVPGAMEDYRESHPTTALLIVEISDTTLAHDRGRKLGLYARAGIADYWLLDLNVGRLEVRREPRPDGTYASLLILAPGEFVSPLAAPGVRIDVAALWA